MVSMLILSISKPNRRAKSWCKSISKGHASYEFAAATAWDDLHWSDQLAQLAARTDAVCFGTLGQRSLPSRKTIRRFLESTPAECLRVFDVNLRSPHWTEAVVKESLPLANVLKCNEDELPRLASPFGLSGSDDAMLSQLIDQFNLRLVAFTRGSSGSIMMNHAGASSDLPGVDTTVVDTVGAGDSFTAAMTLGLLRELPLAAIHRWASRVSAFVCSRPGATPQLPAELCNSDSPGSMEDREP